MLKSGFRGLGFGFWTGAALFVLALAVRCIGLQWGLPTPTHWYSYHPDEYQMFAAISSLDFFRGDFNPDFFNYPSLYIYLSYITHLVLSGFGVGHPTPTNQSQAWMLMHDVLLSARLVTAVLGAATVPLVFLIARQLATPKTGVLAALLLAFAPGVVQHSHFATVDVPATFFVTLCLWLSTLTLDETTNPERQRRALLVAALVAGLAAATKYNAGLIIIAPIAAWFFLQRRNAASGVLLPAMIGVAALGFLLACPFSVLDFPAFWGDGQNTGLSYELLVHPKQGHGEIFIDTGIGWIYHLFFNAPFLVTTPLLIAALWGVASSHWLDGKRERSVILVWCALYFVAIGFSQVRFMRYLIPLAPFICILAAIGMQRLRHQRLVIVSSAILIGITAWGTRDVLYPLTANDPRDQAIEWMNRNTNTPASVGLGPSLWFSSPPLLPLFGKPDAAQSLSLTGGRYRIHFTDFNSENLKATKPQWFMLSELEWREKERINDPQWKVFVQTLTQEYSQVASFKNQPPLALPGREFVPHDFLYPNPEIRIYKKR